MAVFPTLGIRNKIRPTYRSTSDRPHLEIHLYYKRVDRPTDLQTQTKGQGSRMLEGDNHSSYRYRLVGRSESSYDPEITARILRPTPPQPRSLGRSNPLRESHFFKPGPNHESSPTPDREVDHPGRNSFSESSCEEPRRRLRIASICPPAG